MAYMKGVGVLMCLLGSTWIFGILLLAFNDLIIAYAFTILNSLQGVGIFVFQCLLNPQTRKILSRNLQRFKLNFCQKSIRRKSKYQRTNTYEITDFSTTLNTAGNNEENPIVLTNPKEWCRCYMYHAWCIWWMHIRTRLTINYVKHDINEVKQINCFWMTRDAFSELVLLNSNDNTRL